MRTLLVVVGMIGMALGWACDHWRTRRTLVDLESEADALSSLPLVYQPQGEAVQALIDNGSHITMSAQALVFVGNGSDLKFLSELQTLEVLFISNQPVTGADLRHLQQLGDLKRLELRGFPVGAGDLASIRHLGALRYLRLVELGLQNEGLSHVGTLFNLARLELFGNAISSAGLEHLSGLTQLSVLSVANNKEISDLSALVHLKQLQELDLSTTSTTDAHVAALLPHLPSLQEVILSNTNVTEGVIDVLCNCDLAFVRLSAAQVTEEGVARLRRCLPNCRVYVD